jgi:hypothetical protein
VGEECLQPPKEGALKVYLLHIGVLKGGGDDDVKDVRRFYEFFVFVAAFAD